MINLGLSVVFTILFALVGLLGRAAPPLQPGLMILQQMTAYGVLLNLVLCFFNLIPIPPLDGSHLFYYVLPPELGARYRSAAAVRVSASVRVVVPVARGPQRVSVPAHWIGARLLGLVAPYSLSFL